MTPHLVKWHRKYAAQGLTIIEVDNGQIDSLADLQRHVSEASLPFVLLHDADGSICELYGIRAYPSGYLIDRTGKVIWEGVPEAATVESRIRRALAQRS